MKGISAVIATLLMLVITVSLAITAFGFINNWFTSTTSELIDVADASCRTGTGSAYYIVIRNTDQFNTINTADIIVRIDEIPYTPSWNPTTIAAGGNTVGSVACGGAGQPTCVDGSAHQVRVIGPTGRAITTPVTC